MTKKQREIDYSNISRSNLRTNKNTTIKRLENKNGKKNSSMDSSSDKLRKLHTR